MVTAGYSYHPWARDAKGRVWGFQDLEEGKRGVFIHPFTLMKGQDEASSENVGKKRSRVKPSRAPVGGC